MTTGYIVTWSGGYEAPTYEYRDTRTEAFTLAAEWLGDFDPERETIDVLAVDTDAQTVIRLGSGQCVHCRKEVLIDPAHDNTVLDLETGGDVCGWDGGNEPHEVAP